MLILAKDAEIILNSTLYFKFGKNTNLVTMQQTRRKWQTHVPHCMHLLHVIAATDIILVKCLRYLCACVQSLIGKNLVQAP